MIAVQPPLVMYCKNILVEKLNEFYQLFKRYSLLRNFSVPVLKDEYLENKTRY